jgi:hypothetical protein
MSTAVVLRWEARYEDRTGARVAVACGSWWLALERAALQRFAGHASARVVAVVGDPSHAPTLRGRQR